MSQTSNEKFFIEKLEYHFSKSLSLVKEISYNDNNNRNFIEIDFQALHIDSIPALMPDKTEIKDSFSADTIIYDETKDTLYLIEFKEQWPKKQGSNIRLKCYDTLSKLCLFWVNILGYNRADFFKLKIKYCLVTRAPKNIDINRNTVLDALKFTRNCFKIKLLENTFVDETRIVFIPDEIHALLSRITQKKEMTYYNTDQSTNIFS